MEHRRETEIVRILLQQTDYMTIQQLAEQLEVSGKTVRNDLARVEEWLPANGLKLVKKTGVGILIEGGKLDRIHALNDILGRDVREDYSPEARKIYIGLRLITCEENCRIYELADELYVSRATIHKDITALSEIAENHHVGILRKNNNGVQLAGKERALRDLMFTLMTGDKGWRKFADIVQNRENPVRDGMFPYAALDYTADDIGRLVRRIIRSGNPFINSLPFQSLLTVLLRIFISLIRVMEEHFVTLSREFIQELRGEPLYPEACRLAQVLEEDWPVSFPETELRYLQVHFLSLQNPAIPDKDREESAWIAGELVRYWERALGRPFTKDPDLREALEAHLGPAVTRFRHGIRIENPMMYEIQTYYRNSFRIARESVHTVEERYQCAMSDDEVGYLAIHLAAALERMKTPLRTVLVSHGGTGAGILLMRRLERQLPEITIVSRESFLSIQSADLSDIDLILSTLELNLHSEAPVLLINTLIYDYDVMRLKEVIRKYYNDKNDPLRRNVE